MKYIRRDAYVDAIQFTRENWKQAIKFTEGYASLFRIPRSPDGKAICEIFDPTVHNSWLVQEGDYIIMLEKTDGVPHFMVSPKKFFDSVYKEWEE